MACFAAALVMLLSCCLALSAYADEGASSSGGSSSATHQFDKQTVAGADGNVDKDGNAGDNAAGNASGNAAGSSSDNAAGTSSGDDGGNGDKGGSGGDGNDAGDSGTTSGNQTDSNNDASYASSSNDVQSGGQGSGTANGSGDSGTLSDSGGQPSSTTSSGSDAAIGRDGSGTSSASGGQGVIAGSETPSRQDAAARTITTSAQSVRNGTEAPDTRNDGGCRGGNGCQEPGGSAVGGERGPGMMPLERPGNAEPDYNALFDHLSENPENGNVVCAVFDAKTGRLVFGRMPMQYALITGDYIYYDFDQMAFDVDSIPWMNVRRLVYEVVFVNWVAPISTANWFACFSNLASFDARGFLNMANAMSVSGMFRNCSSLTSVNMKEWDVSGVRDVEGLFDGCAALKQVDGFDVAMKTMRKADSVSGLADLEQFGATRLGTLIAGDGGDGVVDGSVVPGELVGVVHYGNGEAQVSDEVPAEIDARGTAREDGIADSSAGIVSKSEESSQAASEGADADGLMPESEQTAPAADEGVTGTLVDWRLPDGSSVGGILIDGAKAVADAIAQSDSIVAGVASGAAAMAKSARDACASSLADGVSLDAFISPKDITSNPYAPLTAACAIIVAASCMLAFALKLH